MPNIAAPNTSPNTTAPIKMSLIPLSVTRAAAPTFLRAFLSSKRFHFDGKSMFRQSVRTLAIRTCSSILILARFLIVETIPFRRKARLRLDPVDDQLRNGVAVALQHKHVAVAGDTEIAEIDEVGLGSVGVEPIGDRFVCRARVAEVVRAGQDQHALAAKLAEIHDAQ